jgi:hypothetical protein
LSFELFVITRSCSLILLVFLLFGAMRCLGKFGVSVIIPV